jgi:hypothetical protein
VSTGFPLAILSCLGKDSDSSSHPGAWLLKGLQLGLVQSGPCDLPAGGAEVMASVQGTMGIGPFT